MDENKKRFLEKLKRKISGHGLEKCEYNLINNISNLYDNENCRMILEHEGFLEAFHLINQGLSAAYLDSNLTPKIDITFNAGRLAIAVTYPERFFNDDGTAFQSGMYNEFSVNGNGELIVRHVEETVKNATRYETMKDKEYAFSHTVNSTQSIFDRNGIELLRHNTSYRTPANYRERTRLYPEARLIELPRNFRFIDSDESRSYVQNGELLYRNMFGYSNMNGSFERIAYERRNGWARIAERGVYAADTQRKTLSGSFWEVFCEEDSNNPERNGTFTSDEYLGEFADCFEGNGINIGKLLKRVSDWNLDQSRGLATRNDLRAMFETLEVQDEQQTSSHR